MKNLLATVGMLIAMTGCHPKSVKLISPAPPTLESDGPVCDQESGPQLENLEEDPQAETEQEKDTQAETEQEKDSQKEDTQSPAIDKEDKPQEDNSETQDQSQQSDSSSDSAIFPDIPGTLTCRCLDSAMNPVLPGFRISVELKDGMYEVEKREFEAVRKYCGYPPSDIASVHDLKSGSPVFLITKID